MQIRLVLAVTVLQALFGLAAPSAEARNRYRVERIYKLALQPGETCARAWLTHHAHRSAQPYPIHRAGNAPTSFGINYVVAKDGRRCNLTVFSISDRIEECFFGKQ